MSDAPATPLSKTEYVRDRLKRDISSGVFGPGHQLRQNDIAGAYGVSPTPVREALRLLASEGVVAYSRHKGATVLALAEREIHDLYELRGAVEGLAVELAADRLTPEQIVDLRAINATLSQHRHEWTAERLSAKNRELHFGIYNASSEIIARHISNILSLTPPFAHIWADHAEADRLVAEHERIIEALSAHDGERARALMEQHIGGSARYHTKSLRGSAPD